MNLINIYWFEQTVADLPAHDDWLSPLEFDHLQTLRVPKRREDWLLGRWTVKNATAVFLGISLEPSSLQGIEVKPRLSGAPELFFENESVPVSLSLTHRSGHAACALSQCDVALGCDLEAIEPHSEAFARDYFAPEEQALVANTSPVDRAWILSLLWSAKESALKALEQGLRLNTCNVIVCFSEPPKFSSSAAWNRLQARKTSGPTFYGWWNWSGDLLRTVMVDVPSGPPLPLPQRSSSVTCLF